jgi:hypothetical protein
MGRQLPPSHLKVPPGPHAFPQRYSLGETVVVNQFTGLEKAIPAIPSLPGFRTSAGMFHGSSVPDARVTRSSTPPRAIAPQPRSKSRQDNVADERPQPSSHRSVQICELTRICLRPWALQPRSARAPTTRTRTSRLLSPTRHSPTHTSLTPHPPRPPSCHSAKPPPRSSRPWTSFPSSRPTRPNPRTTALRVCAS